jgi:hypothetical protein
MPTKATRPLPAPAILHSINTPSAKFEAVTPIVAKDSGFVVRYAVSTGL